MSCKTLIALVLGALVATSCTPFRAVGDDDDDDSAADDDDFGDDDDATSDDDDDAAGDDDDASGPQVSYFQGTYRWFYDLAQGLNDAGYEDCYHSWLVAPAAGTPATGCPDCTHVGRMDLTYDGNDCASELGTVAEEQADFPNVELGIAGGTAYQYNPGDGAWEVWMTGTGDDSSWSGQAEPADSGQYVRVDELNVTITSP